MEIISEHNKEEPSRFKRIVSLVGSTIDGLSFSQEHFDEQQQSRLNRYVGNVALVGADYHDDQEMYQGIARSARSIYQDGLLDGKDSVGIRVIWPDRNPTNEINQRSLYATDFLASLLREDYGARVHIVERPGYVHSGTGSETLRSASVVHDSLLLHEQEVKNEHAKRLGFIGLVHSRWAHRVFRGFPSKLEGVPVAKLNAIQPDTGIIMFSRLVPNEFNIPMHD